MVETSMVASIGHVRVDLLPRSRGAARIAPDHAGVPGENRALAATRAIYHHRMPHDYLRRGDRVAVRSLTHADRAEFTARARASADVHRPWLYPPTTDAEYDAYQARLAEPVREGFAICLADTGELAGYATINNIVQGAFQCGAIGYGGFLAGRGLVTEGVGLIVRHAFGAMGLHRLEANIQPDNKGSIALAERVGFRLEGYSPGFLFVDGAWRDHQRWAITSEMVAPVA
jgi:[ribosomal protein S5]-alanine N-acetyltransferase